MNSPNPPLPTRPWHKAWKHCRHCKRTDRKYHAKGFCKSCYSYWRDQQSHDRFLMNQKLLRLSRTPEQISARYAQQRDWQRRNSDRHRANKRAWNHRNGRGPTLTPGTPVWLRWNGFWCQGTITTVAPLPSRSITVTLKGGTVHQTIGRYLHLTQPENAL